jgi:hypothetical protein
MRLLIMLVIVFVGLVLGHLTVWAWKPKAVNWQKVRELSFFQLSALIAYALALYFSGER